MIDMKEIVKGVKRTKVCSIKPDKESDKSKQITLVINYDGIALSSVFDKSDSGAVIQWQNNNRNNFDKFKNGQVVNIDFKSPGRQTIDPKQALIAEAKADGVDTIDKKAFMNWIDKKFE